jgi:hypothetical protein
VKSTALSAGIVAALFFLVSLTLAQAQLAIGFGIGLGRHFGWETRGVYVAPSVYVAPTYYASPPVVYVPSTQVITAAASPTATAPAPSIPYGFVQTGGTIKSPYSDFTLSLKGRSSGDVIYDANNGNAFKIP